MQPEFKHLKRVNVNAVLNQEKKTIEKEINQEFVHTTGRIMGFQIPYYMPVEVLLHALAEL